MENEIDLINTEVASRDELMNQVFRQLNKGISVVVNIENIVGSLDTKYDAISKIMIVQTIILILILIFLGVNLF